MSASLYHHKSRRKKQAASSDLKLNVMTLEPHLFETSETICS